MEQQLVVFELANESYGINIAMVESIIKVQAITQLPQTPDSTEEVSAQVEEVSASAASLMEMAQKLSQVVARFHLTTG